MDNKTEIEQIFKIVLLGRDGVGKSSYIRSLKNEPFQGKYLTTWGYITHIIALSPSQNIEIIDTPGQELFRKDWDKVLHQANAIILMWSGTRVSQLRFWSNIISQFAPNKPIVIVSTKKDIEESPLLEGYTNFSISNRHPIKEEIFAPLLHLTNF